MPTAEILSYHDFTTLKGLINMPTYIQTDDTGAITAYADWQFPDSVKADFDVVRGWDGKLYEAGTEPAEPAPTPVETLPVTISSDTITIPDAELLVAAATAGDKTAEWLIAKLEL